MYNINAVDMKIANEMFREACELSGEYWMISIAGIS